jgi:hypothetical protein
VSIPIEPPQAPTIDAEQQRRYVDQRRTSKTSLTAEAAAVVVVNGVRGERVVLVVVVVVVGGWVGVDEVGTVGAGVVAVAVVEVGAGKGGLAGVAAAATTGTEGSVAQRWLMVGQEGVVEAAEEIALEREVAAVETDEKDAEREVGGDGENTGDDNGLRSASRSRSKEK